jgi:hypothetical protein
MTAEAAALLAALAMAVLVGLVALQLRGRQRPDAPTQPRGQSVPAQLDRADFGRPEAPWLIAVFTSATCLSCRGMVQELRERESGETVVQEVQFEERPDLHRRYGITAVPVGLIADADGVVTTVVGLDDLTAG